MNQFTPNVSKNRTTKGGLYYIIVNFNCDQSM